MNLLVKVCGMRDGDNIRRVEALGVDFIGFVFHAPSPRCVCALPSYLPAKAKRTGVFVNRPLAEVAMWADRFDLQFIQLHGEEPPEYCRHLRQTLGLPLIKAFHLSRPDDLRHTLPYEGLCDYYLFEPRGTSPGGNGIPLDLSLPYNYQGRTPFLLSGGIGPDSIEALHRFSHPRWAGIDLNSRFELVPGLKDVERLERFLQLINYKLPL